MASSMLNDAIAAATDHMVRLYELSGGVSHDGEKGAFREFFIAELIRPCLPFQFGVGSGVVIDAYKRQSRQSDLIIYDNRLLPPVILTKDRGLYPIDSVLAVIEVKSTLKSTHYKSMFEAARLFSPTADNNPNCLRIATLGTLEGNQTFYPLYAVFGYTSDSDRDEFERLEKRFPGGREHIRLICVLNKGVWSCSGGGRTQNDQGKNAIRFLLFLLNRIEEVANSRGKYRLEDWLSLE